MLNYPPHIGSKHVSQTGISALEFFHMQYTSYIYCECLNFHLILTNQQSEILTFGIR